MDLIAAIASPYFFGVLKKAGNWANGVALAVEEPDLSVGKSLKGEPFGGLFCQGKVSLSLSDVICFAFKAVIMPRLKKGPRVSENPQSRNAPLLPDVDSKAKKAL